MQMKVGELVERTGISVRTLHYYDEIGLLTPSMHTPSGHRLYGMREVARLQQIRSLQMLGFGLEEIKAERDWATLIAEVRTEMNSGTDPTSERVRDLATRWMALVHAFTGGNPEIERSLQNMYQNEAVHQKIEGAPDPEMTQYISRALGQNSRS